MELLKIQIVLLHISTVLSTGEFVRLVNGSRPNQGRVEIYHNGQWGTICDDGFRDDEARAVCRALGYRDGNPFTSAYFGRGSGHIFVDDLQCSSTYPTVNILVLGTIQCTFSGWGVSNCSHSEDVGVECESR
ncbi:scavenger receptor class A member 5-like [Pecten maximus]|uniref:scavenger receptor class A member 5-like n=1 Tax=Pecten maximus TaxID=6579 RepID=UPI00145873CE|nr:scavenger receptor class A member 5-like [Pecten maximus]